MRKFGCFLPFRRVNVGGEGSVGFSEISGILEISVMGVSVVGLMVSAGDFAVVCSPRIPGESPAGFGSEGGGWGGWEPSEGGWPLSVTFDILISLFLLVLVCLYVGFLRHVGSILVLIHENFVLWPTKKYVTIVDCRNDQL